MQIGETSTIPRRRADPYRDTDVIDERAPRVNQAIVALLCWTALATGAWWPAALMGLQLIVGLSFGRQYCLSCLVYFEVIQPLFGEGEIEDARPPRFANILGATFLSAATLAHVAGLAGLGWVLVAMVASLATLAVITGFCMGCSMYRVVARLRGIGSRSHDHVELADFRASAGDQVVVQFTHPLCTDCKKLERNLRERGHDPVIVDVTSERELAEKYGVTVVPLAFAVSSDGRVVERFA